MRHLILALAMMAAPAAAPAAAQTGDSDAPPPGVGVEGTTLAPGETKTFRLAPGKDHQLLIPAAAGSAGSVTIAYTIDGPNSVVTAISHAGPLGFTVLADLDGNGGYRPAGEMTVGGDGRPAARGWPRMLGRINVGDFSGAAPHGAHDHAPSGE